ncbi:MULTISPECIES: methyltransferase family protein [unclassified Brevundimonas]|uniref:methyltransferase family protein n=1 Tax=unclassified Brevundimonas TaxID=2622653 RepID=UPI0025B9E92B|nr:MULTISPECIES: isoprenylcysteine carboxylmethyltransferase family protein [unclassified Brevundimonas]
MSHSASPGIKFPPPLIFLGFLLAGWGIEQITTDLTIGLTDMMRRGIAVALIVVGLGFDGLAAGQMRRHNTAVEPWKGASTLLSDGIFGLTRNPIYLGFTLTYCGFAVAMDSPVALGLAIVCVIVIDRLVIPREEAHLASVFGAAYDDYRQRVRRWI